jgi:hypothetical protein
MTSKPIALPSEDDPLVERYVEKALDLIRDRMPAEDLEVFRLRLYLFYETDPQAVKLLDEIREAKRQAPAVARSTEVAVRGDDALAQAAKRKRGGRNEK